METSGKVLSLETASSILDGLRQKGRRLVQYHDTFDCVYLGQISLFEKARSLGDVLIVSLTAENRTGSSAKVLSGSDHLLIRFLVGLPWVDYLVVAPAATVLSAIECVRPHIYCKPESRNDACPDKVQDSERELEAIRGLGGEIHFITPSIFTADDALNGLIQTYTPKVKKFCREIAEEFPPERFAEVVNDLADLKVLVIGDIIFDRYTSVEVQGLTSKNRILSSRLLSEDTQAGGALAVFRHIRQFTKNVKLISLVGTEPWADDALSRFLEPQEHEIVRSPEFTTIIKQRFVEPRAEGKELSKLFAVNFINRDHPDEKMQRAILERISGYIKEYDLVLVMDFGHGLMEEMVRDYVQKEALFLALNCQTNSNNHGFNIINRQYHRANSFSLDQTEIALAVGRRKINFQDELNRLATALRSDFAWLTRGATETIGVSPGQDPCICAPFERNIVDTVGAGDAFCALASLAAAQRLPLSLGTFLGQLAGAQAVQIVGNAEPIIKAKFVETGMAMLSS